MALQPEGNGDQCDGTQTGDEAGHDAGYRVRHGSDVHLQVLHLLAMLNPRQGQAGNAQEDHHHPDDPWTEDRFATPLSRCLVLEKLEDCETKSDQRRTRSDPGHQSSFQSQAGALHRESSGGVEVATLLAGAHHDGLMRVLALTHAAVDAWLTRARHSRFGRGYDQLTYQPRQELLAFLRANGFKNFIVSGGGVDFMRVWAERVYNIPPERVIGSTGRVKYELREGKPELTKTLDYVFVNDGDGKPAAIHQYIGRRPVLCAGNSDGDQAMLEYTTIDNPRPSMGVLIHHTDEQREYRYDAKPTSTGKLDLALQIAGERGWTVVDMTTDWNTIFAQ